MRIPETFRCSITIRGEQCPCDITLKNAFTFTLRTLDRKAEEAGVAVDAKFLAAHAICPWHARFLARLRRDISRMENTASLLERRVKQAKARRERLAEVALRDEALRRRALARQPGLGAALLMAGVRR